MHPRLWLCRALTCLIALTTPAVPALAFSGEDLLNGNPWWHQSMTHTATEAAGFAPAAGVEVMWHADYIDSYAYNPLWWLNVTQGGGLGRLKASLATRGELAKLHFDDQISNPHVTDTWNRYLSGTVAGLLWAMSRGDVAAARHILGISLHAVQDFYSHSNWVDDPARRGLTWYEVPAAQRAVLPVYTGSYEMPVQLGVLPHGKLDPACSVLNAPLISELMELACMAISPLSNKSICQTFKDCQAGTAIAGMEVLGVKVPDNVVYYAPPGIALDNTWSARIGVQVRQLADVTGEEALQTAVSLATRASVLWLRKLESVLCSPEVGGASFWQRVKTEVTPGETWRNWIESVPNPLQAGSTCTQIKGGSDGGNWQAWQWEFESFSRFPYTFLTAGPYASAALPTGADEWYLRLRLRTGTDLGAGTDADIYLTADGKEFLLDYTPGASGVTDYILAHNDFEAGDDEVYVVGPFSSLPQTITLENRAATVGDVLEAVWNSFVNAIVGLVQGVIDFVVQLWDTITGWEPDYVGTARKVFTAEELEAVNETQSFTLDADGGTEGHYLVYGSIRKTGEGRGPLPSDNWWEFSVSMDSYKCVAESRWDRGSDSDEPFFLCLLVPLPGEAQGFRTGAYNDVDSGESGPIYHSFTKVRVPKSYGMMSVAVAVYESDDENTADRDRLLAKLVSGAEAEAQTEEGSFWTVLGSAIAADWKLQRIEVDAFSRGSVVRVGRVLAAEAGAWIDGGSSRTFALSPLGLRAVVLSAPPTLVANADAVTVDEGTSAVNGGTWTSACGDEVALAASAGSLSQGAGTWSWSCVPVDGPADSQVVSVVASSTENGVGQTSFALAVRNLPPQPSISPLTASPVEGSPLALTGSATDPSPVDEAAGIALTWSVGRDGAPPEVHTGGTCFFTPRDDGVYRAVLTATDKDGGSSSLTQTFRVANAPPSIEPMAPLTVEEGSEAQIRVSASDPAGDLDPLRYELDFDGDGVYEVAPQPASVVSRLYADNGTFPVSVRVTDDDGGVATATTTVTVENAAPTLTDADLQLSKTSVREGEVVVLSGVFADPGTLDTHTVTVQWGDGEESSFALAQGAREFAGVEHRYLDDTPAGTPSDTYTVQVRVTDKDGAVGTARAQVTVSNASPTVELTAPQPGGPYLLSVPLCVVPVRTPVEFAGQFTDPGTLDLHRASWKLTSATESLSLSADGDLVESEGGGTVTSQIALEVPGLYRVRLTVEDDDTGVGTAWRVTEPSGSRPPAFVVAYDPSDGSATGAGWLEPSGSARGANPAAARAYFNFQCSYRKQESVPRGHLRYLHSAAGLDLEAVSFDWLAVARGRAQCQGRASINGQSGYAFLLTALDGSYDEAKKENRLRLMVWEEATGRLIYDNQPDADVNAPLSGETLLRAGTVTVHGQ